MLILKKKTFRGLLMALLVLLSWGVNAQVAVNSVVADDQVQFANNTNFEIGTLTIKIKLPVGKTTAKVTVTLPAGIQYVAGSAAKGANASSVALVAGSPVGTPVFTLVGTQNTEVVFTIKRKLTKAATAAIGGANLTDKVKAEVTGETDDEKDSNPYRVTPPVVTVQGVTAIAAAQIGVNTTTFSIRNTGVGAARTIYFSIDYPVGVTTVTLTPPTGVTLAQVGTVPTGFLNAGKPLYSLTKPTGFAGNELVTITEVFKIAPSLCGAQPKLGYVPYWGLSATELFGENTKVDRNIKVRTYEPKIIQTSDTNKRYFQYDAGLCAATGQKLGTFYTAFNNNSTDATAYNNRIEKLWQARTYFNLTNFYIIATDGTKIPIDETSNDGSSTKFDFSTNAALLSSNSALAGKNIGFTDEDGDGYLDDLKPGAEIRICYDLVSKGIPFACNTLSINPSYTYLCDNACGESIQSVESQGTYRRAYTRINKSIFPAQLVLNTPEKGYLSPGMTSIAAEEQLQGQVGRTNDLRYHYYMQLPSGVGLKNVVFHYTLNDDFTDTTAPTISIGNIAAGGVLSWTTPDTPPTLASGKERLWGHISFELELTNCTGMGASAAFPYTISMMSRNQDGTTFCPIPVACETATIAIGCSVPCTVKGPEMLSTKVERADNSYGWTDATMATRVQRANVSPEQRRKVLPLDTVEFFAEGKQSTAIGADNLFYYVAVKKNADLLPKSIKVKVGTHEMTLQATDSGVITRANDANANYYRWNLTDALPLGGLAAGQTFSVVATYQVSNATENQDLAEQSGITSYFYTLANKNDTAINAQGVHTNALRCGVALIPVFDFGRTGKWNGMNGFILNGCYPNNIGGYYVHLGRNQASGSLLYEEYRPGILMKKIVLKMPLAYKITDNPEYYYTADATQSRNNTSSSTTIPLANWVETIEGNKRVYTYTNPTNTADPYFLRPGMIAARTYNEWLKVMAQASCKSKEFTGTDSQKTAAARLVDEVGYYEIEAEDLYYHYANESTRSSTNIANNSVFLFSAKPQLLMAAQGQGSTIRANKNEQSAVFALEARNNPAPNTWVSIPDITGVEVQGLEEVDNAAGTTVIRTLTPVTSISGEKMFFLNQIIQVGAANQKYYRLKFKLTNCSQPQIKFKVYAGWNCDGNPTQGYRATCDDTFLEYTVNIAQSKKEIEVGSNPTALPMCAKTPFSYIVKSTDEGDIFGANLVVTKQAGIVISDVKVEYPLGSGKVYNTDTPVDGKKIGVVTTTNKTTYKLSDILPEGSLPGSVSTNTESSQKFKVLFDVQPECDFVSGSSFDIDLEGNNLCGVPAIGPKVVAIVAGIQSATVNNYNMLLSSINYINGNANACDNGATYKVRVSVNSSVPSFVIGSDARLHIRFPQTYDIQSGDISVDRTAFPQANANSNWTDPTVVSRTTVGNDSEIIMVVPAGMKNSQYFDVTVKIKQKANTLVDCTTQRNIKVLTTDKITGIACPTLPPSFVCPALIVSTSPERTAVIKNERADLSITEVKATAVPSANKENLTIEYKIANAATASATYNGSVVVSLYNDLNNDGLVEASEVLATHTTTQALVAGATSTVQTFTYLADQAQVCRLRLAIRNIDNKCLCDDKDVALPTPTLGGNLVSNLSTCETASVTFAYNAAAPAYDAYTWSPASYLSAANTPTPTFTYSGAKLTAPLTVTYTLTVKRTNGCESTQTVTVVVTPTTVTPDPNAVNLCAGNMIQSLKQYLGGVVSGTLRVYSTATATAELGNTIVLTNNTTYYYSAQVTGQCESTRQAILVKIVGTPAVSSSYTYCAGTKVAALWDIIDPTDNDRSLKIYTVALGGTPLDRNTVLQNRTYYVADSATNGVVTPTCESARVAVTVNITTVATPTVSATTALCPTAGTQSVSFAAYATALSGNSLRWYATATATVPLAVTPTISTQVSSTTTRTVYVSQVTTAGCEGGRAAITLVVKDVTAPTLSAPAPLVTDCRNAAASITTWLGTVTATDSCGTVSLTNNYNAPADFCNVPNGTLTITFVAKDLFGNTTTQTRTITLVSIKAENDTFTITHGAVATTTANSVLTNDKVGTQTATTGTVSLTVTTPAVGLTGSATPTLNANGTITVPAGTKSGTYQIGYRICTAVSAVTACDTATATIVVGAPVIIANGDTRTVTNGAVGGTVSSVLTNDSYNGVTNPSTNSVTLSWGALPAGVVTTTNIGELKVNPGTASGTHQIPYTICDKINNHNCSTATLTLVIGAPTVTPTITVGGDSYTVTGTITTPTTVGNILTNDSLGGQTPTVASVTIHTATPTSATTPRIDPSTGNVIIPSGTPSGTYTMSYYLCERANSSNCSTPTTVTVTVVGVSTPTVTPTITAGGDSYTVTGTITTPTTVGNILTNDSLGGQTPTVASVTIHTATPTSATTPRIDPSTGNVIIPAGTPSGTYTMTYYLCERANSSNCSTPTTVTVNVIGVVTPTVTPTITAGGDSYTVTGTITTPTTVGNILTNDSLGGQTPTVASVTIHTATPTSATTPRIDPSTGNVIIPAGTPSGTYTMSYYLCERANSSNCSTPTTVTVTVVGVSTPTVTPTITVGGDSYTVTGTITTPTTVGNILTNDSLGGQTPTVASVTIHTATPTSATTPRIDPSTGNVIIPSGTPSGTYTMSYYLCERANSSNCSTPTTVTVTVVGVSTPTVTPTITVGGDSYTVTGTITTPTMVGNILTNDSLGGQTPTVASVTIHTATPTSATTPRIDPSTGNVIIPSGTPSGTYTMSYYLCERANSSNCSTPTTVTVTVVGVSTPTVTPTTIEANGDTFVRNGVPTSTTTLGNILTNDKLNGNLNPALQSVTITTPSMPAHTPYIHPGTGEVIVPPHTPVGVYELPYTICALASPTVCDTATAVVTVNSIEAHNDGRHLLGTTVGGTISSVLANDKLNGRTPVASEVTINWQAAPAGFTYNADGSITVAAGTAVGTYTISYTLCATATPTLCSEPAEVIVEVTAATPVPPLSITAVYDGVYYIEKGTATTLTSVLANDLLDSDPATTGNVSLTWDISAPAGFTLNADGTAHVATNTAVGRYEIPYTICAKNGTLCSTTKLVVTVLAPTVTPTIEVNGETFTYTGNPTVGNVLTNEKLNGTPNPSVRSVTISIMPPPPGAYEPYLDPSTGDVIVPPHTPAGNYTVTYRVCTIDTPVACGVAQVIVVIPATPTSTVAPIAADDRVETARNTPVTINVLANDTPNGATTPNVVTAPLNGTAVVNPDGTIEYTPNTGFVGTDRLVYTLCNAGGCATATVNIEVTNKLIAYNGVSVNGSDKNNHFHIAGIEAYPDNTVRIYNRWGVKVWETQSYDNVRNVFKGISNGRVTVEAADKLPQGTYYYIIEYVDENNQKQTMVGWLYLKKD